MKRVHLQLLAIVLSFIFLLIPPQAAAVDPSVNLNFGKAQPDSSEPITLNKPLPPAILTAQTDGLLVETTGLTGLHSRQSLPANRIHLTLADQAYRLSPSGLSIDLTTPDKLNQRRSSPILSLDLLPHDYPDTYTGKITFKPCLSSPAGQLSNNVVSVLVTVEVKPWVKIHCEQSAIRLESTNYSNLSIQNTQPLRLKIASNSHWILYCRLKPSRQILIPHIKVSAGNSTKVQLLNSTNSFIDQRKNLAVGRPTVAPGNYWCELQLGFEIKNIINYPSKDYSIPLQFVAEFWDGRAI